MSSSAAIIRFVVVVGQRGPRPILDFADIDIPAHFILIGGRHRDELQCCGSYEAQQRQP